MIPALVRFVDALRAEQVAVSPAEILDASRALDLVGPERRSDVRAALAATLAKDRRAHVHAMITSYELPVTHVTRRTGSPYTLVLTKTRALFTRDATERATWTRDLAWLRENAKPRRRMRARHK